MGAEHRANQNMLIMEPALDDLQIQLGRFLASGEDFERACKRGVDGGVALTEGWGHGIEGHEVLSRKAECVEACHGVSLTLRPATRTRQGLYL